MRVSRPRSTDGRRTCRPAGPRDCPSVCAVGMAGQLGWGCRLEWADTTVHIHLSLPSRDWRVGCTIGLSGWPSDMPAGRTHRLPIGLCRRHGRAAGLGVPTRVARHNLRPCTSIFHFPVETGELDARTGGRDVRRTCRPAGPTDYPSVCAVGMAGQLGVPTLGS